MPDGHNFSNDLLFSIIKILSTTSLVNGKYLKLPNQTIPIGNTFSWLTDGINKNIIRIL